MKIRNEHKYALHILDNDFNSVRQDLKIIAKYYRFVDNLTKKETKEKLIELCNKKINDFDMDIDINFKLINSVISHAYSKSAKFEDNDTVEFSEEFLDYFNNLKIDYKHKKVLFVMAILSNLRLKKNKDKDRDIQLEKYITTSNSYRNIKKDCALPDNCKIKNIIKYLCNNKYIKMCNKGTLELLYLKKCNIGEKTIVIENINNVNFGLWFDWHNGLAIQCKKCGKYERKKTKQSNRHTYCRVCREENIKEQNRRR